jgi:hypothetical protein
MSVKPTLKQSLPQRISNMIKIQEARKADKTERLAIKRLTEPK